MRKRLDDRQAIAFVRGGVDAKGGARVERREELVVGVRDDPHAVGDCRSAAYFRQQFIDHPSEATGEDKFEAVRLNGAICNEALPYAVEQAMAFARLNGADHQYELAALEIAWQRGGRRALDPDIEAQRRNQNVRNGNLVLRAVGPAIVMRPPRGHNDAVGRRQRAVHITAEEIDIALAIELRPQQGNEIVAQQDHSNAFAQSQILQGLDVRMAPAGAGAYEYVVTTQWEPRANSHFVGKERPTRIVVAHHDGSIFSRHYRTLQLVCSARKPRPRRVQANSLQLVERRAAGLSEP